MPCIPSASAAAGADAAEPSMRCGGRVRMRAPPHPNPLLKPPCARQSWQTEWPRRWAAARPQAAPAAPGTAACATAKAAGALRGAGGRASPTGRPRRQLRRRRRTKRTRRATLCAGRGRSARARTRGSQRAGKSAAAAAPGGQGAARGGPKMVRRRRPPRRCGGRAPCARAAGRPRSRAHRAATGTQARPLTHHSGHCCIQLRHAACAFCPGLRHAAAGGIMPACNACGPLICTPRLQATAGTPVAAARAGACGTRPRASPARRRRGARLRGCAPAAAPTLMPAPSPARRAARCGSRRAPLRGRRCRAARAATAGTRRRSCQRATRPRCAEVRRPWGTPLPRHGALGPSRGWDFLAARCARTRAVLRSPRRPARPPGACACVSA